jgi:hypothetical protein
MPEVSSEVSDRKKKVWNEKFVGFNVHSEMTDDDIQDLVDYGVAWVR